MKITKSELKEMIKEEASRYMKLKTLNTKKENIEKQLNEMYEEGAIATVGAGLKDKENDEDEMDEGILNTVGSALSKGASKLQRMGAKAIVSDEKKAKGKSDFDKKYAQIKAELAGEDRVVTFDKYDKRIDGLDEKTLKDHAEDYQYQGQLTHFPSKKLGKIVVQFKEGSLTGANVAGYAEGYEIEEGMIGRMLGDKISKAENEYKQKYKAELEAINKAYKNESPEYLDLSAKLISTYQQDAKALSKQFGITDQSDFNTFLKSIKEMAEPELPHVFKDRISGGVKFVDKISGATAGKNNAHGVPKNEGNNVGSLSESEIRSIWKDEAKKAKEAKVLKERAEKIMNDLKNL